MRERAVERDLGDGRQGLDTPPNRVSVEPQQADALLVA
jgi:hypothetical protein